jgi:peptidoglycan hydrolase-like protein with peptidoglycan-binding domain
MTPKKLITVLLCAVFMYGLLSVPVLAQTSPSSAKLIQTLKKQIEQLQVQIQAITTQMESLKQAQGEIKGTVTEIKGTLKLLVQLREGMTGEDVKLLQEILATDPDIYPEGLITGYYGNLTKNAVKRFQKVAGLEQVGNVGPQTLSKLNELLAAGAGNSGKVPPGLLIAPGIRKKVDIEILKPLPGQILPPGIAKKLSGELPGEDTTPPVISEVTVSNRTEPSVKITWVTNENSDSKVYYDTATPLVVSTSTPVVSSTDLVLNHEITLSGLTPNTTYYFIVSSTDKKGNNEISAQGAFSTDITLPVITEVQATNIAQTSAKITWVTNENADSKVWYTTVTPLVVTSTTPVASSTNFVLNHEITLSGLTANTVYYFKAGSTDAANNSTTSAENSFTTLQ